MATKLVLSLFTVVVSFSCALSIASAASSDDINQWCNETPNPEPCKYFMARGSHHFAPKRKSEFKKMAMQVAMERALSAKTRHKELGSKCRTEREKSAWADCMKLYESTVFQLNQTLSRKCSDSDAQTWLSTALTNLETCRAGFVELGVSDLVWPLMSNNVSKLICNSLAIDHKNGSSHKQTYRKGFPTWVSPGDRKLLQSWTATRVNLVVAQDGSGNYRTIRAALAAAAKRRGSGRYVIHVKRGVYTENIEIGINMKNIMLVGDGLKNTIITGSRSVGGGSTTYDSATVALLTTMAPQACTNAKFRDMALQAISNRKGTT
ncbi:hypothetical protein RHGRI_027777 [Rhododendron griersonianum]|uniref:Pectinesterase inhibitor domain-containing protein n=1 Tax=Rhododendron griersonianum TaxID=479676 RepID=A0AAV6J2T6_9ERIC|nr:hypothetical protein RHGRI_027777 [Rhododendron griersonianum]